MLVSTRKQLNTNIPQIYERFIETKLVDLAKRYERCVTSNVDLWKDYRMVHAKDFPEENGTTIGNKISNIQICIVVYKKMKKDAASNGNYTIHNDTVTAAMEQMIKYFYRNQFHSFMGSLLQCVLMTPPLPREDKNANSTTDVVEKHDSTDAVDETSQELSVDNRLKNLIFRISIDVFKIFFRLNFFRNPVPKMDPNKTTVATKEKDSEGNDEESNMVNIIKKYVSKSTNKSAIKNLVSHRQKCKEMFSGLCQMLNQEQQAEYTCVNAIYDIVFSRDDDFFDDLKQHVVDHEKRRINIFLI